MSRGAQVRDTIELLCRILRENGMSQIEAETLRKAKFDKPEACAPLWRLLFELMFFCQHGLMGSGVFTSFINMKTEDQVGYVKKEMQKRGYLSRSFGALSPAMRTSSRELLLALAWLLNKESIITRFMDHRSSPIDDDVLSLYESVESEEGWRGSVFGDKEMTAVQRVQQMLVLNNKLRMNLRLLHASQQHFATVTHRIHNSTYGVSLSPDMNHLSSMQTYMLRHPQHMKKVLTLLEVDSCRLENLLQWEDKDTVFWEWMESVLELKLQQMNSNGDNDSTSTTDTDNDASDVCSVFLDVPSTIGADIAASRRDLMNKILHYESALERLEQLWAKKRSSVSEWELDHLLNNINTEIHQLQARLGRDPNCRSSSSAHHPPRFVFVRNQAAAGRVPPKISNTAATSRHGREVQEGRVCIQTEIGRLQEEADKLEGELLAMRRHCLQRLNTMVSSIPNTVCVLPPQLRALSPP